MFLDLQLRCFGIMSLLAFTVWLFVLITKVHWRHPRPPHCCELVPAFNLPMLCHHSLMFTNLNDNPRKSGILGGVTFENARGKNRFGEELKILDFACWKLILDDAMVGNAKV